MDTTIQLSGMSPAERDALFAQNVKLAEYIARRYGVDRLDHNDRRQAALIGLMQAARRWDPERSAFKTYAGAVIRRVIDRVSASERMLSMAMADIDLLGNIIPDYYPGPENRLIQIETALLEIEQDRSEKQELLSAAEQLPPVGNWNCKLRPWWDPDEMAAREANVRGAKSPRTHRPRKMKTSRQFVAEKIAQGIPQNKIAQEIGISRQRVAQIVAEIKAAKTAGKED